jgi:peptidoglycan/xylan/chitin deacetylase (PgdA/CDA1 family)
MLYPALRLVNTLLSRPPAAARLSILIYHRVLAEPDPILADTPDARLFETQVTALRRCFRLFPLGEALRQLDAGTLPPAAAAITFDDGYADNAEVALPLLQKHGISATFFIATDYLDGGLMFNDQVIEALRRAPGAVLDLQALGLSRYAIDSPSARWRAINAILPLVKHRPQDERARLVKAIAAACKAKLPERLMMTTTQLQGLRQAGMEIGAHTCSHPILASVDSVTAEREMRDSKLRLEALLQIPVVLFAYPNGRPNADYRAEHVAMAQRVGFSAAVSTATGVVSAHGDRFQLPRYTPWERAPARFSLRLTQNLVRTGAAMA